MQSDLIAISNDSREAIKLIALLVMHLSQLLADFQENNVPAKDIYHETVKRALVKDGWVITHDSYTLKFGKRDLFIDLGAEELVAADKEGRKIAVEIEEASPGRP